MKLPCLKGKEKQFIHMYGPKSKMRTNAPSWVLRDDLLGVWVAREKMTLHCCKDGSMMEYATN